MPARTIVAHFADRSRWLFPVAVSLHNLEEAIWMPRFWSAHSWRLISANEFRWLVAAISVLAFVITFAANRGGRVALRLFFWFLIVLFVNAFWHIAAAVYLRGYAPGVITAVVVVLPVCTWLLFRGSRLLPTAPQD